MIEYLLYNFKVESYLSRLASIFKVLGVLSLAMVSKLLSDIFDVSEATDALPLEILDVWNAVKIS